MAHESAERFVEECIESDPEGFAPADAVYEAYMEFCKEAGFPHPLGGKAPLGRQLSELITWSYSRGQRTIDGEVKHGYIGIRLVDDTGYDELPLEAWEDLGENVKAARQAALDLHEPLQDVPPRFWNDELRAIMAGYRELRNQLERRMFHEHEVAATDVFYGEE